MEVFVYADGGSRGNPGTAGSGAVVVDATTKETLSELVYAFDQPATNNVAEYRGLIEGLRAAKNKGAQTVHVFMDSKLVIEQMSGRWKIKHPDMQSLAITAREIAESFTHITYTWIPRAQNAHADKLSNDAMDASAAGAPEGLVGVGDEDVDKLQTGEESARWSGATTQPTRLIFLRHGQTPRSAEKKYAGHEDVDLTELGKKQARCAAQALKDVEGVAAIISSPLIRCIHTAKEVSTRLGVEVEIDPTFIECNFGDFDGLSPAEAKETYGQTHEAWMKDTSVAPPGGESLAEVYARVNEAVRGVVEKHRGKTVIIVTHVNPIKSALGAALGSETKVFSRVFLDVASISLIEYYDEDAYSPAVVRRVNDISHLRGV